MKVTVTEELADELCRLCGEEFWERLADITEVDPNWLLAAHEGHGIELDIVDDGEDYGEVL